MHTLRQFYTCNESDHGSLALDSAVVRKISKRHFFQDIKNSLHGVTRMGLKPHQNFFQNFFSTNMVARGVQSFCILEGATDLLIEQWLKFLCQFTPDMWWANAENFKSISWVVSDLLPFNWKILAIVGLHAYKLAYGFRPIRVTPWREFLISWKKWRFQIFRMTAESRASDSCLDTFLWLCLKIQRLIGYLTHKSTIFSLQ